jgi:hypothetical protein
MKKRIRIKTHRLLFRDFRDKLNQPQAYIIASGTATLSSDDSQSTTDKLAEFKQHNTRQLQGGLAQLNGGQHKLAPYSSPLVSFRVGNHTYFMDADTPADERQQIIKQAQRLAR